MNNDKKIFDWNKISNKDTYMRELIKKNIFETKSCVNCNFRDNIFEDIWYDIRHSMPRYKIFDGYNFEGSTMHKNMDYVGFVNCNLKNTDFSDAQDFHNYGFTNCNMENANLDRSQIDQSGIINSNCKNMTMKNGHFNRHSSVEETDFTNANFDGTRFDNIDFKNNNLTNTKFNKCDIRYIKMQNNIKFNNTSFENCKIENLIINNVFLRSCSFINTKINKLKANLWNRFYLHWRPNSE